LDKSKGRLLIVEDEYELSTMLATYFEMQGFEVFPALTGNEGVNLARQKLPNLVLLDVMLPDLDGFDVCRKLRTTNRTRYIPIIFLTQMDDRSKKVAGLELGADDYITKPFDLEELSLRVKRAINWVTREALTNPRTGLPSRRQVLDHLAEVEQNEDGWTYVTGRIQNIAPFSELYGFVATDEVLGFSARVLMEGIESHGTQQDFVGHLEETSFAIVTYLDDPKPLIAHLEEAFNEGVCTFYNFVERDQGYITYEDESEEVQQAPLMKLTLKKTKLPKKLLQAAH
jgi:PleD family two-component response regulator